MEDERDPFAWLHELREHPAAAVFFGVFVLLGLGALAVIYLQRTGRIGWEDGTWWSYRFYAALCLTAMGYGIFRAVEIVRKRP